MERKLYRSRSDRMISGVCAGIAEHFEIDPTLVRMAAVILAIATFGTAVVAYVIMAIVIPEEPLAPSDGSGFAMTTQPGDSAPTPPPPPQSTPPVYGAPPPAQTPPPPYVPPPAPPSPSTDVAPSGRHRPGRGGIVFGVVLVLLGLALLLSQFVPGLDLWRLWPLLIIALGIRMMVRSRGDD